jgi:hypothetical protein
VVREGEGVLVRAAATVMPEVVSSREAQTIWIAPSRGEMADLGVAHLWPEPATGLHWAPRVGIRVRNVGNPHLTPTPGDYRETAGTTGRSLWPLYLEYILVPRIDASTPAGVTLPGVLHVNGICAAGTTYSAGYIFQELTVAAQVVSVRGSDVIQDAPQWWRTGDQAPVSTSVTLDALHDDHVLAYVLASFGGHADLIGDFVQQLNHSTNGPHTIAFIVGAIQVQFRLQDPNGQILAAIAQYQATRRRSVFRTVQS